MLRWLGLAVSLLLLCPAGAALAQGAAWSPTGCGNEPEKPAVDLSDRTSYNKSVEAVKEYQEQAKTWDACVMKEANAAMASVNSEARARMTAISESANRIQSRVWAGFQDYSEQFKAAQEKLSKAK